MTCSFRENLEKMVRIGSLITIYEMLPATAAVINYFNHWVGVGNVKKKNSFVLTFCITVIVIEKNTIS